MFTRLFPPTGTLIEKPIPASWHPDTAYEAVSLELEAIGGIPGWIRSVAVTGPPARVQLRYDPNWITYVSARSFLDDICQPFANPPETP